VLVLLVFGLVVSSPGSPCLTYLVALVLSSALLIGIVEMNGSE
jgi:hypothetical protein